MAVLQQAVQEWPHHHPLCQHPIHLLPPQPILPLLLLIRRRQRHNHVLHHLYHRFFPSRVMQQKMEVVPLQAVVQTVTAQAAAAVVQVAVPQ